MIGPAVFFYKIIECRVQRHCRRSGRGIWLVILITCQIADLAASPDAVRYAHGILKKNNVLIKSSAVSGRFVTDTIDVVVDGRKRWRTAASP